VAAGDHVSRSGIWPAAATLGRGSGDTSSPRQLPDFLARMYGLPRSSNDNQRNVVEAGPASELDCLRQIFTPALLHAAEARSSELGVGADRVLIQWGIIDEAAYLRHLAQHTGVDIEPLNDISRNQMPLTDDALPQVAANGLLPLRRDGETLWNIAPRGLAARQLSRLAVRYPEAMRRLRLISTAQLTAFLVSHAKAPLAHAAAEGLGERFPSMTAAPVASSIPPWRRWLRYFCGVSVVVALLMLPLALTIDAASSVMALWFLAFASLRLIGALVPTPPIEASPRRHDGELPIYTVIAALYHEAALVAPLLQAIEALDYPKEKLDIILVVEPDDLETRAAIARLRPMPQVQVLIAPDNLPQTKPKALNWALPFARGSFTAVFDAEDIPEPGQLRAALDAFRIYGARTACVQASLCIDNPADSWLSRMFAAEYAGQFDVFLPGLAVLGLPLPLGGSSNHFRTAALREVGGWDAYNVTEDADLGFRLARFGYRAMTFASTTHEEAPARFGSWLRQRSRWMKGWMQTWSVHMRSPRKLWRESGARGVVALNLLVGGNVLTALAAPVLLVDLAIYAGAHAVAATPPDLFTGSLTAMHVTALAAGYLSTIVVGLMGLARRNQLRSGWVLALTPIYWALLSVAAWRALYQFEPYRWEKTEHGGGAQRRIARQNPAGALVIAAPARSPQSHRQR
jgi:cellulose synthase/poly-beta-1,6-N-acetylglucosamine synthase-like glycosyltransferase